jgi:outer membrane receptor for ferrienterochelin and colicins
LAPGTYTVSIVAPGFAPASITVTLPAESPQEVVLSPAPVVEQVRVVSASRQDELRESLNTRVDVVTRSRMQDTGAETVAEVLRELPGVVTRRGSETAGAAGAQVQGVDSRQVLVLLDGLPLVGARGIKRGVINLDRQSTARLERVEVVKGAASALYGSDAIGGVINLISRDATAPLDLGATVSGGSHGDFNARAEAGARRSAWSGLFVAERHQNDGFDLTPTTFDTTGAPFRRTDGFAKLRGQFTPSLSMSGLATGYDNRTTGRSTGELGPQEDVIDESLLNAAVTSDWLPAPATSVQMRVYHARFDEDSAARLAPPLGTELEPGRLDERLLRADASLSHALGSRQIVQVGLEYTDDEYSGINRLRNDAGEDVSTGVVWGQHRLSLGRVTTTVGARFDNHSIFGSAVSPKVAANMLISDGVYVRGSYGRGFRAPDIGQLYYRFLNPTNFYQVIGNPNLEPEYSHSFQAGTEAVLRDRRARVGVNAFRNDVDDLIESVSLGFVATPGQLADLLQREGLDSSFRPVLNRLFFTYKNVNDAVTQGIEADGEVAVTDAFSVAGAYTYLDAYDAATGLELTGRHRHQGHIRAAWQHEGAGFRANVRGTFFSSWIAARSTTNGITTDTTAPGFALWDAFVSQDIVRGLSGFAAVDNLTDNQDPNTGVIGPTGTPAAIYRPEVGRTVRFGVRWSWPIH